MPGPTEMDLETLACWFRLSQTFYAIAFYCLLSGPIVGTLLLPLVPLGEVAIVVIPPIAMMQIQHRGGAGTPLWPGVTRGYYYPLGPSRSLNERPDVRWPLCPERSPPLRQDPQD